MSFQELFFATLLFLGVALLVQYLLGWWYDGVAPKKLVNLPLVIGTALLMTGSHFLFNGPWGEDRHEPETSAEVGLEEDQDEAQLKSRGASGTCFRADR